MKTTRVSEVPTFAQSIFETSCPVTNVTAEVCSRWVSGTPVYAAMPSGRGNSGDDFKCEAGVRERFGLLSAPPEEERIATLQANDVEPAAAAVYQQVADFFLRERMIRLFFPYVNAFGGRGGEVEKFRAGQIVVED